MKMRKLQSTTKISFPFTCNLLTRSFLDVHLSILDRTHLNVKTDTLSSKLFTQFCWKVYYNNFTKQEKCGSFCSG